MPDEMPKFETYEIWERHFLEKWPQAPHTAVQAIREVVAFAETIGMDKAMKEDVVLAEIEKRANQKASVGAEKLINDERRKFAWVQRECVSFVKSILRATDGDTKRDLIMEIKNQGE